MPWPWHSGKPLKRKNGKNQYLFASGTWRILWIELFCVGGDDAPIERMLTTPNAHKKFERIIRMGAALIRSFSLESTAKTGIQLGPRRPRVVLEANQPPPGTVPDVPVADASTQPFCSSASASSGADAPLGTDENPIGGGAKAKAAAQSRKQRVSRGKSSGKLGQNFARKALNHRNDSG